jgi:hypothetical protein
MTLLSVHLHDRTAFLCARKLGPYQLPKPRVFAHGAGLTLVEERQTSEFPSLLVVVEAEVGYEILAHYRSQGVL